MTQYKYRMTVVVGEPHMSLANWLALFAGESPDDVNTFTNTDYQDSEGNKYAVCSTVIKPIVLSLLNTPLVDSLLQAEGVDTNLAQQAMDKVVMYEQGVTATPEHIYIAIDIDPFELFESLGLTSIVIDDVDAPI